jgi:hypothetical protein
MEVNSTNLEIGQCKLLGFEYQRKFHLSQPEALFDQI